MNKTYRIGKMPGMMAAVFVLRPFLKMKLSKLSIYATFVLITMAMIKLRIG